MNIDMMINHYILDIFLIKCLPQQGPLTLLVPVNTKGRPFLDMKSPKLVTLRSPLLVDNSNDAVLATVSMACREIMELQY